MRVIIGSISYYPNISGVAVSTHLLAGYLAKRGHQVFVITPGTSFKSYREKDPLGEITIFRLKAIPNPFRKGFYLPFGAKGEIKRIVQEIGAEIVHLQDPTPTTVFLAKVAQDKDIPVIVTNHFMLDYVLAYLPKFLHPFARKYLFKKLIDFYNQCEAVTCPTETVKEMLLENGVKKPVFAFSNGVDIHRFYSYRPLSPIRAKYHIPQKPIILYLGRIDKDKSIQVLIEAIPKVLAQRSAHFVLAGGGDFQKKFKKTLEKQRLDNFVTMTGPIPHEEETLVSLYQLADIFVIPSTIETQSIVTMEAMAAGKPIVGAKAGALPELIKPGENGFLFPPGDSETLAKIIVSLLDNKKLRKTMGEKSLELVARHELDKNLSLFEKLYVNIKKNT